MIPYRLIPALGLSFLSAVSIAQTPTSPKPPTQTKAQAAAAYARQPIAFQPNRGQAGQPVQYLSRGRDYTVLLQPDTATLVLARPTTLAKPGPDQKITTEAIRMTLTGADPAALMAPDRKLPGYVSYLYGDDRAQWQTGIPTYAATRVTQPYPGVDLVYYGNQRNLEYDFLVAPHADASQIHLNLQGATPVLEPTGELRLQGSAKPAATDILFHKPVLYQQTGSARTPVEGAFTLAANGDVSFQVGPYDHTRELVIDPVISYASYFGGPAEDEINGIALNAANQLYAVGQTFSTTLPATTGEYQTTLPAGNNGHDAFITKFSADGSTILWTTFLGSSFEDFATSVAVNATDQAYVAGYTNGCVGGGSQPLPFPHTTDAVQTLCGPNANANNTAEVSSNSAYNVFLVKLSSDGTQLLYGTFLGGNTGNSIPFGIVLDRTGRPYITGITLATQYFYSKAGNYTDSPSYPANQHGVVGFGNSNYPTTPNAFYSNTAESYLYVTNNQYYNQGPQDEQAFITILSADLHSFVYSSLLGGPGTGGCGNGACNTDSYAVAVNAAGQAFIGGNTVSALWPVTASAFVPTCTKGNATNCPETAWLAGFDPTKSGAASLLFNTYLNGLSAGTDGSGNNMAPVGDVFGLITDSAGNIIATGDTNANNYPTTSGAYQTACAPLAGNGNSQHNTCNSAFITKLTATGSPVWSTYYRGTTPGAGSVAGRGLAVDPANNVYLVGSGYDPSLPLLHPFVSAPLGTDFFVSEFSADATTLLAGTWVGIGGGMTPNNGMAIDSSLNVYFSGSQAPNPYGGTSFPYTANAPDKTIQGADGFVVKVVVQTSDTKTALTITPVTAAPGAAITFTATVTGNTAGVAPTQTVTLTNGTGAQATTLGTITLAAGTGTFTTSALAAGTYSVIATYNGDATYNSSASAAQTLTIKYTPTVALTATPTSGLTGTTINLSATVSSAGGAPTGTVVFVDGTTTLGSATLVNGIANYSTSTLTAGPHSISAQYGGSTTVSTLNSTAVTVTITAPLAAISFTATPASVPVGAAVALTANVTAATGTGTPSGKVTFFDGATNLGFVNLVNGSATVSTTTLAAGTHTLTAQYGGDGTFPAVTSTPATVTVRALAATTTTLTATPTSSVVNSAVTFTATVNLPASYSQGADIVTFYEGTTSLGFGVVTGSMANFTTQSLAVGTHSVTASFSGDTVYSPSTSAAFTVLVSNAGSVTFAATPNPITIRRGHSGVQTITATPNGAFAGTVTFFCSSLPQNASCVFSPTVLTFLASSSAPQTSTLTIYTNSADTASLQPGSFFRQTGKSLAVILWLPGSALALFGLRRKNKNPLAKAMLFSVLALCSLAGITALSGCGGNQAFNATPAGTYTIPITVTTGSGTTQSFTTSIIVQ